MSEEHPTREPDPAANSPDASDDRPLSLNRLREAFAEMLAPPDGARAADQNSVQDDVPSGEGEAGPSHDPCEICPRSVVEAMLFVGRPDNHSLSARELAAAMRGVSPSEIDAAVAELNAMYARDSAPYEIVDSGAGYRMVLRKEFGRMRDKFHGRVREAKLSPAAVEVLSIVAYHQPITAEAVCELRGVPSGAALATLVRRKLVRLDRPADSSAKPQYVTTERFLRLFGLENINALPRSEELQEA